MPRKLVLPAVVLPLVAVGYISWRLTGQVVNVVVVNASGQPVDFAWQPRPFAEMVSLTRSGCESSSEDLHGGEIWRLSRDGETIAEASTVQIPITTSRVAVEIWLDADGSVRVVPPYEASAPIDAPYPAC